MLTQNFCKEVCGVVELEVLHSMSKADFEKLFLLFHIVCKKKKLINVGIAYVITESKSKSKSRCSWRQTEG